MHSLLDYLTFKLGKELRNWISQNSFIWIFQVVMQLSELYLCAGRNCHILIDEFENDLDDIRINQINNDVGF